MGLPGIVSDPFKGSPSPSPDDAQTPDANADKGAPSPTQKRIDQLTRQKHDAIRALDAANEKLSAMEARFAALEQKLSPVFEPPAQGNKMPNDWRDLTEDQAKQLLMSEHADDPAIRAKLMDILMDRKVETLTKSLSTKFESQSKQKDITNALNQAIQVEFGPELSNPESGLRDGAIAVLRDIAQIKGPEVAEDPLMQYLAYMAADRTAKVGAIQTLKEQVDALTDQVKALSGSRTPVTARSPEQDKAIKESFQKGNIDAAIGQLRVFGGG